MKKQIGIIVLMALVAFGSFSCKEKEESAEVTEVEEVAEIALTESSFVVDTASSVIIWNGSKPGKTHTGTLNLVSGDLGIADGALMSGTVVIDMNSLIVTDLEGKGKANLEAHLKGTVEGKEKDFFNVTEFPTATFEITDVTGENGSFVIKGDLTIKDITNNVSIPAIVMPAGNSIKIKSASFEIDRTQWEVNFKSKSIFDDLKDNFIKDNIQLTLELTANKA